MRPLSSSSAVPIRPCVDLHERRITLMGSAASQCHVLASLSFSSHQKKVRYVLALLRPCVLAEQSNKKKELKKSSSNVLLSLI